MDDLEISDNEMLALLIAEPETAMTLVMDSVLDVAKELQASVDSVGDLDEDDKNLYVLLATMIYMYNTYVDSGEHLH